MLHCGAAWSARSREVAERLSEWARPGGAGESILCATSDLEALPNLISERNIKGVPTVLLLRGGRTERRADGADTAALERVLAAASAYDAEMRKVLASAEGAPTPQTLVAAGDELLRQGGDPVTAAQAYRRALDAGGPFAFRARLGLLGCILRRVAAVDMQIPPRDLVAEASSALADLVTHHGPDLAGEAEDAGALARQVAHAELLVDAWEGHTAGDDDERKVLQHYADGDPGAAVDAALRWYQREAGGDIEGLIEAYCSPERRFSDREGDLPPTSIYTQPMLERGFDEQPGPTRPRALLRRLFMALGSTHEIVSQARAELELLLDRRRHVPFYTRRLFVRQGGMPKLGRGTGSRSGYSRVYWIAWGPGTYYRNSKPMGGPHTADGKHSFG